MIQDITPYRYRVEYRQIQPRGEDVALLYQGNRVLLREASLPPAEAVAFSWEDGRRMPVPKSGRRPRCCQTGCPPSGHR